MLLAPYVYLAGLTDDTRSLIAWREQMTAENKNKREFRISY